MLSRFRRRHTRRGVAELYSALVVVAVTLALSYAVYQQVKFPSSPAPVYSAAQHSIYGSPSLLWLRVNSTSPSSVAEMRVDDASSLAGVLELSGSSYVTGVSLCGRDVTTFFSVFTGDGMLSVVDDGSTWIDGNSTAAAAVSAGWHEVIISGASSCSVVLPGGRSAVYPSDLVSTVPFQQPVGRSFVFLVPYSTPGHTIVLAFDGAVETYGF